MVPENQCGEREAQKMKIMKNDLILSHHGSISVLVSHPEATSPSADTLSLLHIRSFSLVPPLRALSHSSRSPSTSLVASHDFSARPIPRSVFVYSVGTRYFLPPLPPSIPRLPTPRSASKEWVIPSKPKPGRKPKKETVQAKDGDSQVSAHRWALACAMGSVDLMLVAGG